METTLQPYSFTDIDSIIPKYNIIFDHFKKLTRDDLMKTIFVMNKTTCVSDPFPTKLLISHLPAIVDIILGIVNLCFESAVFPLSCKSSVIILLIKKPGLDSEILKNYRPVATCQSPPFSSFFFFRKKLPIVVVRDVCPSVRPSVRPAVCPSVCRLW